MTTDHTAASSRDTQFFWDGLEAHELRFQVCDACATPRHPPRPACARCASPDWTSRRASGEGTLYSYTVLHHPPVADHPMPYGVGLVELDEGVRMVGELDDRTIDAGVEIGSRVEVGFVTRPGGERPLFRAAGAP